MAVPKMLPYDILFPPPLININRMKSGRIWKEGRKKCVHNPADLKAAVTYIRAGYGQKSGGGHNTY